MAEGAELPSAGDVFAAWLSLQGTGTAVEFEALCRDHAPLAEDLRELHDDWVRLSPYLEQLGEGAPPEPLADVIARLRERAGFARYVLREELARGGMGLVLSVWDVDLKRELAMKRLLEKGERTREREERALGRFLDEAQITGQLDHPSIVPVHELGVDGQGRLYFTMRRVRGDDLAEILERMRAGDEAWSQARVLHALLRACEALAYAHAKGVIHRDVKPANIMVGRFGEVYVMDWGLARMRGRPDDKDVRVRPPSAAEPGARHDTQHLAGGDSPIVTMDGDVVGTPSYMSPEQARGELSAMGPWSDVYSMGALLYHLLAGHAPYVGTAEAEGNAQVWLRLQQGPPPAIAELAPEAPAELLAICEKAMAREPALRYADVRELAEDLRAFLEVRVVQAYRSGPLAELQTWVRRNRALAASAVAAVALAIAGLASTTSVQAAGRRAQEQLNSELADSNAELARSVAEASRERDAAEEAADFLVDLFEAPDPAVALGASHSAEDLLERGAARLADFPETDPLVRARLFDATGRALRGLGRYERAEPLLAQALELRSAALGDEHPDALRSVAELAGVHARQGRADEAVLELERALARAQRALGPDDPLALELQNDLGAALQVAGRLEEAAEHLEASVAGRRAALGDEHEDTLVSLTGLASLQVSLGRYDLAEELFGELFERLLQVQGEDHPRTLTARNNLATLRAQLGRNAEAEALYRAGVESARRILGDEHPDLLVWWNNLAKTLQRMGRADEARAIWEQHLAEGRERFGSEHPRVVPMIQNLGVLHLEGGRLELADALLSESLAAFTRLRGEQHIETLFTCSSLGRLRLRQGRAAEAEELFERAHEGLGAAVGEASPFALAAGNNLALARARLGRFDEARSLYAAVLAAARERYGETSPRAWLPWRNLIGECLSSGRAEEALRLAEELLRATPEDSAERGRHEDLVALARSGDPAQAQPGEEAREGG